MEQLSAQTAAKTAGIAGVLLTLAPAPFLLALAPAEGLAPVWRLPSATGACLALLGAALLVPRWSRPGKLCGFAALAGSALAGLPYFATDPLIALLAAVLLIQSGFVLAELPSQRQFPSAASLRRHALHRARAAAWAVSGMAVAAFLLNPAELALGQGALAASVLIGQGLTLYWLRHIRRNFHTLIRLSLLLATLFATGAALLTTGLPFVAAGTSLLTLLSLPRAHAGLEYHGRWWEPLLNHPARVLLSTFLGLCLIGTLLLQLPWVTANKPIALIDAAFTAVSAVCVTGLTVLDTPNDFSLLGQGFLLLLIQLGGLGIMTITTVALHVMGRRLSLRQERLLTTMTETSHLDLIGSLLTIVRLTLVTEGVGAVLLATAFLVNGDALPHAAWRGLFTAVSAFCNAGFALQSTNLIPYQQNPLVLHTVAALIVLGGLAPATCLILPRWLRRQPIDLAPRITLATTVVLLLAGTVCFLIFEWHNTLAGLPFFDKLHNAWFQSVTLRTAGFNSIDISTVLNPTYLIMLLLMFIGGSPGGTAGGIKTTTIGLLAMTFWASITGRTEVVAHNRRIPQSTVNRAITVFFSGVMVWFVMVLALTVTQQISGRSLLFEVTSALGTVGLSIGATTQLDEIGKIIIMLTMFIGRIGPMTLFTLLSEDVHIGDPRYPDARITLT